MNDAQRSLSRRFLAYRFFLNLWFVEAIWLYFYRLFMNDAQVGILDTLAFGIGILAEIPSGALADKFGRSRIAKIGILIAAVGLGGQAIGGFWPILAFQSLVMIGFAFISGADEALFFEKLRFKKDSTDWRRLITRAGQMAYAACIVAIPLGGFLYQVNHQLVFILNSLMLVISAILIWNIRDARPPRSKQTIGKEFKDYVATITTGFRIFAHKNLRLYIPLIITVQGVLYMFNWGLLKIVLMDRFHFSESFGGIILGVGCLLVVIILHFMQKHADKLHEKRALTGLSIAILASLLISIPNVGLLGIAVVFILYAGDGILYPFISEILHKHAPNDQRATVISVASFIKTLPYILAGPLIGWLNMNGQLHLFLIGWSVLIVAAWLYYFASKKRDDLVAIKFE